MTASVIGRGARAAACALALGIALAPGVGTARAAADVPHAGPDTLLAVPGLAAPARVLTDRYGIPHVEAQSLPDLYFAWGFVTARDRLFELEYTRRAANGFLWRSLGNRTLLIDAGAQLFELASHARRIWHGDSLDPAARMPLERYAAGIDAWLARCRARQAPWPREFTRLGWRMADWSPADCELMLLAQGVVLDLSIPELDEWKDIKKYGRDWVVRRQRFESEWIYDTIPDSVARARYGPPRTGWRDGGPGRARTPDLPLALIERARRTLAGWHPRDDDAAGPAPPGASNVFAVGAARSTTGAPLLANDPHLELSTPSPLHVIHVRVPGVVDAIGAATPGFPVIVTGRNARCAWGVTALQADNVDLYADTLSADGRSVRWQGGWVPVRNAPYDLRYHKLGLSLPPFGQRRRYTPHGPVLAWDRHRGLALAVRWAGLDDSLRTGRLLGLEQATRAESLCARFRTLVTPALNLVAADVDGDVRYQTAGRVPHRAFDPGLGPLPSDPTFEWPGFIAPDSMPAWDVPRDGFVVNCNNRPIGPSYPDVLPRYDFPQDRALRIGARLAGTPRVSYADMMSVQNDVFSRAADRLAPRLLACMDSLGTPRTALERAALDTLRAWDHVMRRDRVAATLYRAWLGALVRRSRIDEPGLIVAALDGRAPEALRRPHHEAPERPALAAQAALALALKRLQKLFGPDLARWPYGRAHRARFVHPVAKAFERPSIPADGDFSTVSVGSSRLPWNNTFAFAPAFRHLVNLADADSSLGVIPPGNSGDLASPHAYDMIERWAMHRYVPFYLSWSAAEAAKESETRLMPPAP